MATTVSELPNSNKDKKNLEEKLFEEDLSDIGKIDVYFYVSEYYLISDLSGDNSGLFLNFFPKELQSITNCPSEKINIHIIYPKDSKQVNVSKVQFGQLSKLTNEQGINYSVSTF